MSTKKRIEDYIVANPDATNKDIARKFGTTSGVVCQYRMFLRKRGELPKFEYDNAPAIKAGEVSLKEDIKSQIRKKGVVSLIDLSDQFDIGVGKVRSFVRELVDEGHSIDMTDDINVVFAQAPAKSAPTILDIRKMEFGEHRFGVTGDNHLCSRYARLDVLNSLYDEFARQGISVVYNTGNWIDGEARFNKHDLLVHGMDNQIDYFLGNYPQRDGITTMYITGDDHEGWYTQREGVNVGAYTEMKAKKAGREDLKFIGHMEADIVIPAEEGKTVIRILHPGGGSSYAISYTSQKIVESYTGGEKPDILIDGHYHKAGYNYIRGVHVIQSACTQDQTPFMRKKRLAAHLGGWIVEFSTDPIGAVTRFGQTFFPFYDGDYYTRWGYKWK